MIQENIRRTVSVLLLALTAVMPVSAIAMSSTPDEAVQTSTPDSAVRRKKQPVSSGSSQGGIYPKSVNHNK